MQAIILVLQMNHEDQNLNICHSIYTDKTETEISCSYFREFVILKCWTIFYSIHLSPNYYCNEIKLHNMDDEYRIKRGDWKCIGIMVGKL